MEIKIAKMCYEDGALCDCTICFLYVSGLFYLRGIVATVLIREIP